MEPLVLVPGLACTKDLFGPQIAALSQSRDVVVADTRQDDSIARMAARLLERAPPRFALAGLSMGGYVAMEALRQEPGRVARVAFLDTTARPDGPEQRAAREELIRLAQSGRYEEVIATLWPRLVAPRHQDDSALEARVRAMALDVGSDVFVRQERAIMGREDSRGFLPGIEIPTLVLVGEEDKLTPPEVAREMAEMIEWASLVVVPESGHLSTLERPDAVTRALQAWLEI